MAMDNSSRTGDLLSCVERGPRGTSTRLVFKHPSVCTLGGGGCATSASSIFFTRAASWVCKLSSTVGARLAVGSTLLPIWEFLGLDALGRDALFGDGPPEKPWDIGERTKLNSVFAGDTSRERAA